MTPEPPARAARRAQLRALIAEAAPEVDGALADHDPLITSGLVESSTLVAIAIWVEEQVGAELDLAAFDLAADWDSVDAILAFVERHAPAARGGASG